VACRAAANIGDTGLGQRRSSGESGRSTAGGCIARKRRERARREGRCTCSPADAASEGRPVDGGRPGFSGGRGHAHCWPPTYLHCRAIRTHPPRRSKYLVIASGALDKDLSWWPLYSGDGTCDGSDENTAIASLLAKMSC
jgi:hypothetical protein